MQRTHHFGSAHSCVSWYSVASMTYFPQDTPCWGSVLAGTATLLVSVLHGYCTPCFYCICNSWSISYSCFICGSYFTCDSCYVHCSCCTPYPVLVAWLHHPWSLNIPGHGGVIGISLWRGPGSFMFFFIKQGGLSFGYCLVKTLLMLAVQVPYGHKWQWHRGHCLYRDVVRHPGLSGLVQYLS